MGVSGGVWECGKPERFSIISMPPVGLQNVRKEV